MDTSTQFGFLQFNFMQWVLLLIAIAGVGLLISSLMSVFAARREVEIFEDGDGRVTRRWRRHRRRFHWKRGSGGIFMVVISVFLLWLVFSAQEYLGLTNDVKIARIQATQIDNSQKPLMDVTLTFLDQDGHAIRKAKTYNVEGDLWMLQGNIVKFPSWMNIFGIHSGYKVTRLEGLYQDPNLESNSHHTVVTLNGGDGDFFKRVYKQAWSSPFVEAAYGNAVILPADGNIYDVYVSQTGLYAKPEK